MLNWLLRKRLERAFDKLSTELETKSFHEIELDKIIKATARNERARSFIRQRVALEYQFYEDVVPSNRVPELRRRLNLAAAERHAAIERGAHSHAHPEWAAAAVAETWILSRIEYLENAMDEATLNNVQRLINSI